MPSSLITRCVPIREVLPHPNADNLVIVRIMGFQVVVHKDTNPQVGDLKILIQPDSILPDDLAKELGVEKYLAKGNKVKQVRLRGEMSFGIMVDNKWGFQIGEEVSEKLGITKWVPPPLPNSGDQEQDHPLFNNYSRIQNWRNYPNIIQENEPVYFLEKIDGTNSKVGVIKEDDGKLIFMIGSHNTRRKLVDPDDEDYLTKVSIYQYPLRFVEQMLEDIIRQRSARSVIVYGEIFGRVQKLRYGLGNNLSYRAFDICIDGQFLNWNDAEDWLNKWSIKHAPIVYCGPYSEKAMKDCANQNTLLMPPKSAHISEGIVIRPQEERIDPSLGRVILKYRSDFYEEMKAKGKVTEYN